MSRALMASFPCRFPSSFLGRRTNQNCALRSLLKDRVTDKLFDHRIEAVRLLQVRWTQSEQKIRFQPTGLKVQPNKKDTGWDWFATPAGRKGSFLLVALFATGAILFQGGRDTFGQNYVREVYQHYTNGFKTKVSKEMEGLFQEVMSDANLSDEEVLNTKVFVCYGTEAASWGFFDSRRYGVLVGYPHHLHYSSPKEVDLSKMRIGSRNSGIPAAMMETLEAEELKDSFCLSQDAKKFIIARELEYGRCGLSRRGSVFQSVLFLVSAYACCRYANRKLHLFARHRVFRLLNYGTVGSILGLANLFVLDRIRCQVATKCDEAACRLGPDYCRGGVEYYSKILQRHVALRTLMPNNEGKKLYNLKGDFFPGLVRTKIQPISLRKEICSNVMASLGSNS